MFNLRSHPIRVVLSGLVITALLAWFWNRPDPRARFLAEVESMLESANRGAHLEVLPRFSPEARLRITEDFMEVSAALRWAARIDAQQRRTYRLANLAVFSPRDYAEVEIERSAPNGEFTGQGFFPVPFIWRDGQWWIAGSFRGDRKWDYPE